MKIIVLNHRDKCVEVVPVYDKGDEQDKAQFDAEAYLANYNFPLTDISWMICDSDLDEVPVYWAGEVIPYIVL